MFSVKMDTSEIERFIKESPKRAEWASREALNMAGGHYRKEIQHQISTSGEGSWPVLKQPQAGYFKNMKPLEALGSMVRFRVGKVQKRFLRLKLGFFHMKLGSQNKRQYNTYKERFKARFGMSPMALARVHEYGRRQRVTKKVRAKMAAAGWHLKKTTTALITPVRPMIEAVWSEKKNEIPAYLQTRFFQKFFNQSEGPRV